MCLAEDQSVDMTVAVKNVGPSKKVGKCSISIHLYHLPPCDVTLKDALNEHS